MSHSKKFAIGILMGIWTAVFVFIVTVVVGMLGLEISAECWPALMGPSLIGLIGGVNKEGMTNFFATAACGLIAALAMVVIAEKLVVMTGGAGILGFPYGLIIALIICVAVIITLGFYAPKISGPVSFVYFCAGTVLTTDIWTLTICRLVILLAGTAIFVAVEHLIIGTVTGGKH